MEGKTKSCDCSQSNKKLSAPKLIVLIILIIAVSYIAFKTKDAKVETVNQEVGSGGHSATGEITIEVQ